MVSLYRDPNGENVFSTSDPSSSHPSTGRKSSGNRTVSLGQLAGFEDSKVLIKKLENRVSQLKEELDRCDVSAI